MRVDRSGRSRRAARLLLGLAVAVTALLSACHGTNIAPPGTPVISISTTNATFAAYVVSVTSITFSGPGGAFIEPLVTAQSVDLTRLTDIAELLEAPAVPSGTYTSATLNLDYSNPGIWANTNGTSVVLTPTIPVGPAGIANSNITITFDPAQPLVITNGQSTRVAFTLDLDAFNSINLAAKTVTVLPYAVMSLPPVDASPMRARGSFVVVQSGYFIMNLRPFYDLNSQLGAVFVYTNAQTNFNVNGVIYTGAPGLAAMTSLPINTTIAAYGTLSSVSGITPSLNASTVLAGSGIESPLQDHLRGVVSARTGDTLTLSGADYLVAVSNPAYPAYFIGYFAYLATNTVNIGSNTLVTADGANASGLSAQSISVGQEIDVAGVSAVNTTSGYVTLDATQGQVRLTQTPAWGVVNAAAPNNVTLDLLQLGPFAPQGYNFTGTATGGGAVDPLHYLVNTGSIDESGTATGTLLELDGLVNSFGAAPPAFNASSITLGSATQQILVVEWTNGGPTNPFATINPHALIVDLSNPDLDGIHFIYTGPQQLDLKTLPSSPIITTDGVPASQVLLSIGNTSLVSGVSTYVTASAFTTALNATVAAGTNHFFRLSAIGHYNSVSNTFVASRINVALQE